MRALTLLILLFLIGCNTSSSDNEVQIIIDYKYYESGVHGNLEITQDSKHLFTFPERSLDTILVPEDWLVFIWSQDQVRTKEIFPKHGRIYKIYGSMFKEVD